MRTLYLIDGYAQFFRHYHAIRTPMTSPVTKEPTNMTFGFVGMLLKLLGAEPGSMEALGGPPDALAVALDVSGDRGTFRSQLYADYKANRTEPPEDLAPQVERCLQLLREIGVPIFGVEGYEADDVLASIVRRVRAEHPGLLVRLVSKDKDLKQLFEPVGGDGPAPVALVDVHTGTLNDARTLEAELGLRPDQVIDMLALMGDTVDNVPGVPGVGEKTAAKLLREHGTIEALLQHAGEVKGKLGENLRAAADRLPLSRRLVALHADLEIPLSLEEARTAGLHLERLMPFLKELGFNRYQDELRAIIARRQGGVPTEAAGRAESAPTAAGTGPGTVRRRTTSGDDGGLFGGLFGEVSDGDGDVDAVSARAGAVISGEYRCIRTRTELAALVEELRAAPLIAIDTETTGLSPLTDELCGVSLSAKSGTGVYIPVRSPRPNEHLDQQTVIAALRPLLEDPARPKVGHNLKFDMLVLRRAGVNLEGLCPTADNAAAARPDAATCCDTMVASYLIDSLRSSHGLDALGLALLHQGKQSITELIGAGRQQRSFDTVELDAATGYAAADADLSLRLAEHMTPQMRAMGLMPLFREVELPLVEVLAELEWNGVLVDPDELDRQRERLSIRIKELARTIDGAAMESIGREFDPDSPRQLSAALFNKPEDPEPGLGIKPLKRTKTGFSTDAEVLEKLAEDATLTTPIPRLVLEYRQLTKLVSTYLVALKDAINPHTRRVHASFNQTVAATGRLSSSDPNLQNIPIRTDIGREIRRAFVAPPGHVLITADYSQIELRLLAHLSRDPALIEAFHRGADIHTEVAAQIHGVKAAEVTRDQRSGAKMVNFGIVYGITSYGLARRLGIGDREAGEIIAGYKRRFAGITTFLQECVEQARRYGYVETMLKRRRPITDIDSTNPSRRALAERMAINSVVQGSAADLIKLAMVDLHRRTKAGEPALRDVRMLLQVHDELVFEAPQERADAALAMIVERMEHAMPLSVPITADAHAGRTWYEGK